MYYTTRVMYVLENISNKLTHWLEPGDSLAASFSTVQQKLALSPWTKVPLLGCRTCYRINNKINYHSLE